METVIDDAVALVIVALFVIFAAPVWVPMWLYGRWSHRGDPYWRCRGA